MSKVKLSVIETGGRNDFGTDEIPIATDNGETCQVCGEMVPDEKVSSTTISSRKRNLITVFACRDCRVKFNKLREESGCPNCSDPINQYMPNRYLRFTGHEDFGGTPRIEICEGCFEGYEEL